MPVLDDGSEKITDLYATYKDRVFNLAYRMTGDKDVSEDIVQETFMQVLKYFKKFKGESHVYTWIFTIARNLCYRYFNQSKRSSHRSLEDLIQKASQAQSDESINEMQRKKYALQVKEGCLLGLLRCLSFHQRIAFILNVLFDIPFDNVAKIIGKSRNSTRILVHRARKNILAFLCKNCSLYDGKNQCRCENLISFSLQQGWISQKPAELILKTELELASLKQEIHLYKTLPDQSLTSDFDAKIAAMIKKHNIHIFSIRKVK